MRCHLGRAPLGGAVGGFALADCGCGRSEPAVFPYWPALRWEGNALCREVSLAAP